MGVCRHVHRQPGDRCGEVGAVIEVETAQIVLIGFAFAAVLADHQPRHRFEDFAGSHQRTHVQLVRDDRSLRC